MCMTDWERQSQRAQHDLRVGKKEEVAMVTAGADGSEEVEMEDKGIGNGRERCSDVYA